MIKAWSVLTLPVRLSGKVTAELQPTSKHDVVYLTEKTISSSKVEIFYRDKIQL